MTSGTRTKALVAAIALAVLAVLGLAATTHAQNLATDPFVQDTLKGANFEPGGPFFPNLQVRGSVIPQTRSGQITVTETYSQMLGRNLVLKQGTVQGQHNFTIDLTEHHPHSVHSPFDNTATASKSVRYESESKTIDVNLTVNGLLNHPADGYDPPQGGGFPPCNPYGAVDHHFMTVSGQVQGTYVVSQQELQKLDTSPYFKLNTATYSTGDRSNGFQNAAARPYGEFSNTDGFTPSNIGIRENVNPNTNQTQERRLGGPHWILDKAQGLLPSWLEPETATFEVSGGLGLGSKGGWDVHVDLFNAGTEWSLDQHGNPITTTYVKVGAQPGASAGPWSGQGHLNVWHSFTEVSESKVEIGQRLGIDIGGEGKAGVPYVVGIAGPGVGGEAQFMLGWKAEMSNEKYANLNPLQRRAENILLLGPLLLAIDRDISLKWAGIGQATTTEYVEADVGGYLKIGGSASGSFSKEQMVWSWPTASGGGGGGGAD